MVTDMIKKALPLAYIGAAYMGLNSVYSKKANGLSQLTTDLQNLSMDKLKTNSNQVIMGTILAVGAWYLYKAKISWYLKAAGVAVLIYMAVAQLAKFVDPPEFADRSETSMRMQPTYMYRSYQR